MINRRVYFVSFDLKDIVIGRGYRVFQNCNFEQMSAEITHPLPIRIARVIKVIAYGKKFL